MKDNKNVTKDSKADFVFKNFQRLFPDKAEHVESYERSGSKMITLLMDDGMKLFFLYYNPMNWNLGTKPWRMKPKTDEAAEETAESVEEGNADE